MARGGVAALCETSPLSKPKTQAPPPSPPAAASVPSLHPVPHSDLESRIDLIASQVSASSELFTSRLAVPQALGDFSPCLSRSQSDSARVGRPLPPSSRDCWSPPGVADSGREPGAPATLPYGQAQLGRDMRASAGLDWASPPSSTLQAPHQPPPAPGVVFVPPLSAAALSVAAASYMDPRFAPPPLGIAPGGSSAHALPPRLSSASPGTPRVSGSKDSDSGSSSASAALDSAAVHLADLVYDFCPEARLVSDSAPPPRCGFESWFDPSPTSSSSRPRYRVYPWVAAVESEVADCAAALHRRSKPLSAVLPHKIRCCAVADQPLFVALQPLNPSCGCFSRGV